MFKRIVGFMASVLLPVLLLMGITQVQGMMGETAVSASPRANAAAPYDVIISEVAWGGTSASYTSDEWIELYNNTNNVISLIGWTLNIANQNITITLQGSIPPNGFYLLERTDDETVSDIDADKIYTGSLNNNGDRLFLRDNSGQLIDSANGDGGGWPAGSASPGYYSMERTSGTATDVDANWQNNDGITRNGLDAGGHLITGTAKSENSGWNTAIVADLSVTKNAPAQTDPDSPLLYDITLRNSGSLTATSVILTDTLPTYVTYVANSSGYTLTQPDAHTLVWQVGPLHPGAQQQFVLTTTVSAAASGTLTNSISATTPVTETNLSNNWDTAVTTINSGSETAVILDAVLYDGYAPNDADEAVSLRNISEAAVNLTGWQLNGKALPALILPSGGTAWLTKNALAFSQQFGFAPQGVLAAWPGLTNTGDEVLLANDQGQVVDVLVYENGDTSVAGWSGTAVQPYTISGQEGQILYRRRDPFTNQPVPDTNSAADWAQSLDDVINGRKVRYPGWDLDEFFFTTQVTETAVLTLAIAPDNAYEAVVAQIDSAMTSIQAESHTFENTAIADALALAATRGVSVTLFLEGGPAGGVSHQEHYLCQQLMQAGGLCAFMINDANASPKIFDRYDYLHAKFMLIDGQRILISTQNLSPNSLPADDKSDGTWGRRGLVLITDAPSVVAHGQTLFARDFDLAHPDIILGVSHLTPLPLGFVPITETGGTTYTVRYPEPAVFSGLFPFELVQSPENSLREVDALLGLVNRAGAGDEVWVQQLYERPFWGSNAINDPNPRLEAYLNAARRGAHVRLLLDEFFDDDRQATSNSAACHYVKETARREHLNLECALANPTGLGIHNKMVLVRLNGQGYIHVGSINGSETSNKANRELALQVQSNEAYALLADLFDHDWPYRVYLPTVLNNVLGLANHPLISEIQYNPPGLDDGEYVELANPTARPLDLSGFSLGDAVNPADYEDVRLFPPGTVLAARSPLVVATSAAAFFAAHGFYPDFEILETVTAVPNLIDDPAWGDPTTFFQLGNSGDEVLLRNASGEIVDVVTYGSGIFPGVIGCPLVSLAGAVLERVPYDVDTDNCLVDFREWPFPSPGALPD